MLKNKITSDIYYIDNFFEKSFIDKLYDKVLNKSLWRKHTYNLDDVNFYWGTHLKEELFGDELNIIKNIFKNFEIIRIYVNGQSGVQHGNIHVDDGEVTFLLGFTKNWSIESGGGTEFFLKEDLSTSVSIYPIYNRLMRFPANIKHRALPNIDNETFRMTLAIKTLKLKNSELDDCFY